MDLQSILPALVGLLLTVEAIQVSKTVKDNVSAPNVPQLYSSTDGVYASGMPYLNPTFAASQLVPVREETLVIRNKNGFLKDSYGNNFVESPQKFAYKMTYPQQYVKLQDLPLHLSQPLSLPSQNYANAPQYTYGNPHRVSAQESKPSFSTSVFSDSQGLAPHSRYSQALAALSLKPQQLSSNQKPIYTSKQPYKYYANSNNVKFQRLEQNPDHRNSNYNQNNNYQNVNYKKSNPKKVPASSLPQKHYIITKNGKKTPITLTTNAPLPHLLDVSLLKPLTFANPIVPQVQHYLPKINYHVPKVDEERKHHNEFVVTKTKSYDTSQERHEPPNDNSSENNSAEVHDDDHSYEGEENVPTQVPKPRKPQTQKPSINVNRNPAGPVHSYEINSPGYKESFSQQVVNYDKNTEQKPVVYSYGMKIEKKPVHYSFSHSSNNPPTHSKQVHIKEEHNGIPKRVVYSEPHNSSQENYDDDHSMEYEEAPRPPPRQRQHAPSYQRPAPLRAQHREVEYYIQPRPQQSPLPYNAPRHQVPLPHPSPPPQAFSQIQVPIQDIHLGFEPLELEKNIHFVATPATQQNSGHGQSFQQSSPENIPHHNQRPTQHSSRENNHENQEGASRDQNYENVQGNSGYHFGNYKDLPSKPQRHNENHGNIQNHGIHGSHQSNQQYRPINGHPHQSHSDVQQNRQSQGHHQNQYRENRPTTQQNPGHNYDGHSHQANQNSHPNSQEQFLNEFSQQFPQVNGFQPSIGNLHLQPSPPPSTTVHSTQDLQPEHRNAPTSTRTPPSSPKPYSSPAPTQHVVEKSHKIIIQDESPDEMHSHKEHLTSEVVNDEENKEEDFEKLYKEAALGFPAYERDHESNEREIFDPDNYAPSHHVQFDAEQTPLQQFVEEGDEFPKSARLNYKDAQENLKEDYYLDYSVNKPESFMDRYKNKVDYYKMYKKHRQPSNWGIVLDDQQPKKSEPYTVETIYGHAPQQNRKGNFAQYQNDPSFEYDYLKEAPPDSFAHASKPSFKANKLLEEPQFLYGFQPVSIPHLFDSELTAMASNNSPKSDKGGGKRKKIYKENWYIKKTTTNGRPAS